MTRREQILAALVILLIGILVGVLIAFLVGDDDATEAGEPTTTTTEAPPTTEAPTTTATPTTTSDAPTTTVAPTTSLAPTTTEAPPAAPVANATNGEILGLAPGSSFDEVLAAMIAVFGEPDNDTGWNVGCPLDGGTDDDERRIWWGNLAIRFFREGGVEELAGFAYQRGAAGFFDPEGPTPDDIVMDPGVAWNQTIGEVAAALGGATSVAAEFPLDFVSHGGEGDYRAGADHVDAPMDYAGYRAFDICE